MTANDRVVLDQLVQATKNEIDPNMADDEFFELFCAQSLLLNERLEEQEIKSGLIGGDAAQIDGSDGGIDAIYVLVNGRLVRSPEDAEKEKSSYKQNAEISVVLIQASREEGFKLQRLLRIKQALENIFSLDRLDFSEQYNSSLLEAINTFRTLHRVFATKHVTVSIEYFYMTRGDVDQIAPDVNGLKKEIETNASNILATIKKCEVNFIGARGIFDLASQQPVVTHLLPCSVSMCQLNGGAYVGLVKITDYFNFIKDEKQQLRTNFFDTNVRDFQGDADVNKAIGETLLTSTDQFWWLNNGITIVTTKIGGHEHELAIDDPQIVNGLQTSQKIFDHFTSRPDLAKTDQRELLIRVIQVNDSKTQDDIIEATNSQTKVAPSSFWATKTIHRDIETVFLNQNLFYDRRKNSYRRKGIPLNRVVGIAELAQAVASTLLQEPEHARARPARYFSERKQHDKIFSDKYDIAVYAASARFGKTVGLFLHDSEPNKGTRRNILFYVMMVAACLGLKTLKPRPQRFAQLESRVTTDVLKEATRLVMHSYAKFGGDDKAAKGPDMAVDLKKKMREKFGRKSKKSN